MAARWSHNPYALARLVLQEGANAPGDGAGARSPAQLERLLGRAFKAELDEVFYGAGDVPSVLERIDAIADAVTASLPLERVLALPGVRALVERLPTQADAARLLPFLVPVDDMDFVPGASVRLTARPVIGRYADIGPLSVDDVSWRDPVQGSTADCYLIAAMTALAYAHPAAFRTRLSSATGGSKAPDTLRVFFHADRPPGRDAPPFDVPPRVPVDPQGNQLYAHSEATDETWPGLLERGFVMQICGRTQGEPGVGDYRAAGSTLAREPQYAARMLMGGTPKRFARVSGGPGLSSRLPALCEGGLARHAVVAATWPRRARPPGITLDWRAFPRTGLVPLHAYALLGTMDDGDDRFVVLRNPYGSNPRDDLAGGPWQDGAPRNGGAPVDLHSNGVFALPTPLFDTWFHTLGWVELPDAAAHG
jgi:hypothetical protein